MSLTSELSNPHSAVSRFMSAHLPATAQVTATFAAGYRCVP
ncbi:hypothetical protein [Streptomyces hydrogenans]